MKDQTINKEIDTYFSLLTPAQKESVISLIKSLLNVRNLTHIEITSTNNE